ncbi:MAG TPA: ABC transporter ATP-binding protein [Acidimicrobiales bacterium]
MPTSSSRSEPASGDRLLVAAIRRSGRWLVPLVVLDALGAVAALAFPAVLGRTIDDIFGSARSSTTASLTLLAGLMICMVGADAITQLLAGTGTARATGTLRRDLVRHILAVGPGPGTSGDLVARLVGNTATSAKAVVVVAGLAAACIPPIGAVVVLAAIDPWLALTFAVGMVSVSGAVRAYLRGARAATEGYLEAQASIASRLVDALDGARTIAAAGTTAQEVDRVLVPLDSLRRHGTAVWRTIARLVVQGEPVVLLTQVAVVAVAGVGVAAGRLTPGEMLAASRYAVMAAGIGGMLDELAALTRARAGAERLAEVLTEPAVTYGRRKLPPGPGSLELRGITAGPADRPVLADLDLELPGGQAVALVGRSGAGKSLVAALAGRLCDPVAGEVRLDGVPVSELERHTLRAAVAYAFERPILVGDTIADAVGFGVDQPSLDHLRHAAEITRAAPFIARLPDGFAARLADTPLSGGEIQRLGLARAMAHGARVLILDDATSSLDTATEAEIAAAVTNQMRGRTRLIVTHRLGTAARADLVAWLDDGRIRAYGPHRELLSDPEYQAIFRPEEAAPQLVTSSNGGGSA